MSDFLKLACLNYLDNGDAFDGTAAVALLREQPELSQVDIFHACAAGDLATAQTLFAEEESVIHQSGGPFEWPPLLYACYSRAAVSPAAATDLVDWLLKQGVDPNASFLWADQYRFTALTGVFGEGEGGPQNFPENSACFPIARLLLEAGANPNDCQALYNRMFTPNDDCLKLLLEFGLSPEHKCNWLLRDDDNTLSENPQQMLRYLLNYAIKSGFSERAKLLIESGADLTTEGSTSLYETAMLSGDPDLAQVLIENGGEQTPLDSVAHFISACMSEDASAAQKIFDDDAKVVAAAEQRINELLHRTIGRPVALQLFLDFGANPNLPGNHNFPLHEAAWLNDCESARRLIAAGANPSIRDFYQRATPVQWARYRGDAEETLEFLQTCEVDVFDAALLGDVQRMTAICDHDPAMTNISLGELCQGDTVQEKIVREIAWKTPLMAAVHAGQVESVHWLLERGVTLEQTLPDGTSLPELARSRGHEDVAAVLEAAK